MVVAGEHISGLNGGPCAPNAPDISYLFSSLGPGRRGERWWRWLNLPKALWAANRLVRQKKCGAIVVVFPDELFLLVGYLVARWNGTSLYPYYHNTYTGNRRGIALAFARWLEPRVIRRSVCVFAISEALRDILAAQYPGARFEVLRHPVTEGLPPAPKTGHLVHDPLRLVLFGNINDTCQDAAVRLLRVVRSRPDLHLTLCSGQSAPYLVRLGFEGPNIRILGIQGGKLMAQIREADVVLLPHGLKGPIADIEIATIFPTKTTEALFSGRPILAHAPASSFLAQFLRARDCALVVGQPSEAALSKALDHMRDDPDLRLRLVRNALTAAQGFRAKVVATRLRGLLADTNMPSHGGRFEPSRERPG